MFEQARAKLGEFGDFLSRYKHFPVKLVFVKSALEFSQTDLGFYEPMPKYCVCNLLLKWKTTGFYNW